MVKKEKKQSRDILALSTVLVDIPCLGPERYRKNKIKDTVDYYEQVIMIRKVYKIMKAWIMIRY